MLKVAHGKDGEPTGRVTRKRAAKETTKLLKREEKKDQANLTRQSENSKSSIELAPRTTRRAVRAKDDFVKEQLIEIKAQAQATSSAKEKCEEVKRSKLGRPRKSKIIRAEIKKEVPEI